jgi:hypothetical protein
MVPRTPYPRITGIIILESGFESLPLRHLTAKCGKPNKHGHFRSHRLQAVETAVETRDPANLPSFRRRRSFFLSPPDPERPVRLRTIPAAKVCGSIPRDSMSESHPPPQIAM